MAYDPKDPADKKIVDDLVAAALADASDEHETATQGLKNKIAELRGKLAKAKTGEGDNADADKLEAEVERLSGELKQAKKDLGKATKDIETLSGERDGLDKNLTSVLVDQGLTSALTEAGVAPQFLPAVKALLGPQVALKDNGGKREAVAGDKPLGEFVKIWSQGDEGKTYISAAGNSGGGAGGSQGGKGGNGKTMTLTDYNAKVA